MFRLNISPKSLKRIPLKLIPFTLLLLLLACPEPEPSAPQKADCPNGQLPCEEDSTICCDVICPPGTLLGGEDSTECIPVECPEYYYLCGEDSTDCCLETTSHEIIWEVDTIFTGFVNYAEDVAIINDTTIWVVGEFELDDPEDTLTYFEERFNLIRWNGIEWIPDRILSTDGSQVPTLSTVFVIDSNIWVGSSIPRHFDGSTWAVYNTSKGWISFGGFISKIWGSGSNDVFFISINGQVNHWDGTGFTSMDTPTEVHLIDIYGTGPNDVWAVGFDLLGGSISTLIHYDGIEWSLIYEMGVTPGWESVDSSLSGHLRAVQTFPFAEEEAWIMANTYGIYRKRLEESPDAELIPMNYTGHPLSHMRGSHPNDLFIAGHNSGMYHWNGETIHEYSMPGDVYMTGLVVNNNKVFTIGIDEPYSIVFIGSKSE